MSIELVPFADYAKEECQRVKNALPVKKEGDVRFAFITDFHYKYMKTKCSLKFTLYMW